MASSSASPNLSRGDSLHDSSNPPRRVIKCPVPRAKQVALQPARHTRSPQSNEPDPNFEFDSDSDTESDYDLDSDSDFDDSDHVYRSQNTPEHVPYPNGQHSHLHSSAAPTDDLPRPYRNSRQPVINTPKSFPHPNPMTVKLPIRDKFSSSKYSQWLHNLSDHRLQREQLRCSKAKLSSTSSVIATAGALTFLDNLTGGIGLALNTVSGCQKLGRMAYYREHRHLCDVEMKKRGIGRIEMRDRDIAEEVGMGVVKAVAVRALVG